MGSLLRSCCLHYGFCCLRFARRAAGCLWVPTHGSVPSSHLLDSGSRFFYAVLPRLPATAYTTRTCLVFTVRLRTSLVRAASTVRRLRLLFYRLRGWFFTCRSRVYRIPCLPAVLPAVRTATHTTTTMDTAVRAAVGSAQRALRFRWVLSGFYLPAWIQTPCLRCAVATPRRRTRAAAGSGSAALYARLRHRHHTGFSSQVLARFLPTHTYAPRLFGSWFLTGSAHTTYLHAAPPPCSPGFACACLPPS